MIVNTTSIIGSTMHIASHAFGKITLFFCAGAIYVASGKTEISQIKGIGKVMPWTMAAFTIGSLSIIGLPPTGGFISKWFILLAAIQNEEFIILLVLIITLLSAAYLLPVIYSLFQTSVSKFEHSEAPIAILIALGISVSLIFYYFLFPNPIYEIAKLIGI